MSGNSSKVVGDDTRQGVSEPLHGVLDLLERGRAGWSTLSVDAVVAEMEIEAGSVNARASADDIDAIDAFALPAATRFAALVLHLIERAAPVVQS